MTPTGFLSDEPIGTHFIDNGDIRPIDELADRTSKVMGFVYEVVRIIDGVPLFLEEHAARLVRSARLTDTHLKVPAEHLSDFIGELVRHTGLTTGNVKVALGGGNPSEDVCLISFIASRYPADAMYQNGVSVGIFSGERHNPTVKQYNPELRRRLRTKLEKSGHHDLLLESADRFLTEGSKHNVFLVDHDTLITPPENDVLPGITRMKVIQIAARLDIPLIETRVHRRDLGGFDAAFLTGTSAKLLPIHTIDGRSFRVDHPQVRRLMAEYDRLIDEYVRNCRAASS
ncbi:MAG: aminotransferase class IV family protein [Deltaproteobacteria bacterium]|nr:aminotransferase class IV family protein [Candidatus Zymogenaceae bacterium]